MDTKQKIVAAFAVLCLIGISILIVVRIKNKQAEDKQKELEFDGLENTNSQINPRDLILGSWDLILSVLKKKKQGGTQAVTTKEIVDYVGSLPGKQTA